MSNGILQKITEASMFKIHSLSLRAVKLTDYTGDITYLERFFWIQKILNNEWDFSMVLISSDIIFNEDRLGTNGTSLKRNFNWRELEF